MEKDILMADLDLHKIAASHLDFDVVGHYSCPDIFQLKVNEEKLENVKWSQTKK